MGNSYPQAEVGSSYLEAGLPVLCLSLAESRIFMGFRGEEIHANSFMGSHGWAQKKHHKFSLLSMELAAWPHFRLPLA